ncbi:hypothetical protein ACVWWG_006294 [Bradyrhizobium sp. LB7.2]
MRRVDGSLVARWGFDQDPVIKIACSTAELHAPMASRRGPPSKRSFACGY